ASCSDGAASSRATRRRPCLAPAPNLSGFAAWMKGDYARAWALGSEAPRLYQDLGDAHGIAFMYFALGFIAGSQGQDTTAQPLLEQSQAVMRQLDDKRSVTRRLIGLTDIAADHGSVIAVRARTEEALRSLP